MAAGCHEYDVPEGGGGGVVKQITADGMVMASKDWVTNKGKFTDEVFFQGV